MASVSEMLVGSALQSADKAPDIGGAIESGVGLAMKIQQVQQQKAALEQQKQEQYTAKIQKFSSLYETAAKLPPGAARNGLFKTVIPKTRDALGLQKEFPDDAMIMLNANPEVMGYLKAKVENNEMTLPQILEKMQDTQWIADNIPAALQAKAGQDLTPQVTEDMEALQKSENFRINETNQTKNAALAAQARAKMSVDDDNREPEKQRRVKVAKDHATFEGAGGFAKLNTQIAKLKKVRADLESGALKTGPSVSNIAGGKTQAVFNPNVAAAQGLIRSSIDLKKALDSSFSDAAAAQAYSQSFDALLPTEKNKEKLDFLIQDLENAKKVQKKNFMRDKLPVDDPMDKLDSVKKQKFMKMSPAAQKAALPELAKYLNMTPEDLAAELGVK